MLNNIMVEPITIGLLAVGVYLFFKNNGLTNGLSLTGLIKPDDTTFVGTPGIGLIPENFKPPVSIIELIPDVFKRGVRAEPIPFGDRIRFPGFTLGDIGKSR